MVAVFLVYGNTLESPFLLDDYSNIVDNPAIEIEDFSWNSLTQVWDGPITLKTRKIAYLSFAMNYLWGGYDPIGYHLVNIGIHFFTALLVFLFFQQTLDTGWLKSRYGSKRPWLASGAALIWALHPIQVNAVTYIVQRMTSLAVLFALISLTAWMAGRKRWKNHQRIQAVAYWMFGVSAWISGLLCKEHVAILPLLILIQDMLLFRRGKFYRLNWRWLTITVFLSAALVFFYLGADPIDRILSGYHGRDFTLIQRLLTEPRVLWHYISLFFIPIADRFSIFYDFPVSSGLFSPITTFFAAAAWLGVAVAAWKYRGEYPVTAWVIAWFLAGHLIESTVLPLEIIFEHRMYFPSIALALSLVLILHDLFCRRHIRFSLQVMILLIFCVILGGATYTRNMDFKDEVTLHRAELRKFPDSVRNQLGLAVALLKAGRITEGGDLLKETATAYPNDFVAQQNWYVFLVQQRKDIVSSQKVYQNLVKIIEDGNYVPHRHGLSLGKLADLLFEMGDYAKTLLLADRLLKDHRRADYFLLKGISHANLDQWPSAERAFHEAWNRDSRDVNIIYWYGKSLIHSGEPVRACRLLTEAVREAVGDSKTRLLCQKLAAAHCSETR